MSKKPQRFVTEIAEELRKLAEAILQDPSFQPGSRILAGAVARIRAMASELAKAQER
jgi:hypothetical protein